MYLYMYYIKLPEFSVGTIPGLPDGVSVKYEAHRYKISYNYACSPKDTVLLKKLLKGPML